MTFSEYLNHAWNIHPTESSKLLSEFKQHFYLIETEENINDLAHLITHVSGEHLAKYKVGLDLVEELSRHSKLSDKKMINRFMAILSLAEDSQTQVEHFSESDQLRIFALTAAALAPHQETERAETYLKTATERALLNLKKDDPAFRTIAASSNSIASNLEEKSELNLLQKNLMITAANMARRFWEIAGTWKEVERAEYRLAYSHKKAQQFDKALAHASTCIEIIAENGSDPFELFFGYEALGLVEKERGNPVGFKTAGEKMRSLYEQINPDLQVWCSDSLKKFE